MDYFRLLLRIIHIGAGVFWVGGVLMMTFFIVPSIGAAAEGGQRVIAHLMNNMKFSQRMSAAAGSTILAGFILYGLDARAGGAWLRSSFAIGLGIGAVFALVGFVFGIMLGRTMKSLARLGSQLQGKPTSDQAAQLQALQKQQFTYSRINAIALILSVIFMAIARYLVF